VILFPVSRSSAAYLRTAVRKFCSVPLLSWPLGSIFSASLPIVSAPYLGSHAFAISPSFQDLVSSTLKAWPSVLWPALTDASKET